MPTRGPPTPGGPADEAAAGHLARENDRLKEALAKAEAKLADDPGQVGKLERQLKGARTQNQNLQAKLRIAVEAAKAKGKLMERSERMAIVKCQHEDHLHADIKKVFERHPKLAKQYETACQTFNELFEKWKVREI